MAAPPPLQLFNSMRNKKELFKLPGDGRVGMYVSVVTPYDFSHAGHARAYVAIDVLYRYLKFLGYEILYTRCFTDIEDKFNSQANQNGETITSLGSRFINELLADMADLQCLPPAVEPRVRGLHTEHVIELITKMITKGLAYVVDGNVYFIVKYWSTPDQNRAGWWFPFDPRKKNPSDIVLWKAVEEGEPSWESPWGHGRPGISAHSLGHITDCRSEWRNVLLPYNQNEFALRVMDDEESDRIYWIYNVSIKNDDQNMKSIKDITTLHHPLALRFFLMRTHYRSPVNYSDKAVEIASYRIYYIYQTLYDCDEMTALYHEVIISVPVPDEVQKLIDDHHKDFLISMSDDLRTTEVLDGFMELLKAINSNLNDLKKLQKKLEEQKKKKQQQQQQQKKQQQQKPQKQPEDHIQALAALNAEIKNKLSILGLMPSSSLAEVLEQLKAKALKRAGLTVESLREQIEQRATARNKKQFEVSDMIRKDLASKGIALMDEPTGTVWIPCEIPSSRSSEQEPVA